MTQALWKLDRLTLAGRHRPRLDRVTAEILAGVTAVVGYSGAGKTSLLNLLAEFERPTSGSIVSNVRHSDSQLPLYWVPQNYGLWPHLSVEEHLAAVEPAGPSCRAVLLHQFHLHDVRAARPDQLSEGESSRLAVARALASQASVLVMDEPLAHVDPARIRHYWQVVREHCSRRSLSMIFATHVPESVLTEAERAICLKDGRLLFAGLVDDLYHRPATQELAELLGPVNWLHPKDAEFWLHEHIDYDRCYRPEQIGVRRDPHGPFAVASCCFAGSISEVELVELVTHANRRFYHRERQTSLRLGERVSLKIRRHGSSE